MRISVNSNCICWALPHTHSAEDALRLVNIDMASCSFLPFSWYYWVHESCWLFEQAAHNDLADLKN